MKVRALAVAVALALGCGGESSKLDGGRGKGTGGDGSSGSSNGGSNGTNTGGSSRGGTNATSGASGSGADGTGGVGATIIYLYDENNFRSEVTLSIPVVETASGVDLEVCWTDVVSDLDCLPIDPRDDIDGISWLRFRGLTETDVEELLAGGELPQSAVDGILTHESSHETTCTQFSSFTNFGTQIDVTREYVEDDDLEYLFVFSRGAVFGSGSVTMLFAKPTESSMTMRIDAEPGCDLRTLTATLGSPVRVPFDGPFIVDFANVTHDGQGNELRMNALDKASLWFVAGATPSSLEGELSGLDARATESFDLELDGDSRLNLALMTNANGEPFSSFRRSEDGVWLFGLTCSACVNAEIPRVLAVFEPGEAP